MNPATFLSPEYFRMFTSFLQFFDRFCDELNDRIQFPKKFLFRKARGDTSSIATWISHNPGFIFALDDRRRLAPAHESGLERTILELNVVYNDSYRAIYEQRIRETARHIPELTREQMFVYLFLKKAIDAIVSYINQFGQNAPERLGSLARNTIKRPLGIQRELKNGIHLFHNYIYSIMLPPSKRDRKFNEIMALTPDSAVPGRSRREYVTALKLENRVGTGLRNINAVLALQTDDELKKELRSMGISGERSRPEMVRLLRGSTKPFAPTSLRFTLKQPTIRDNK
uniref:Uncharacterized protein n=1 Tax=viral metagenome TaxID=1070528 RepID=A0A6C0E672_9ZZZZ